MAYLAAEADHDLWVHPAHVGADWVSDPEFDQTSGM